MLERLLEKDKEWISVKNELTPVWKATMRKSHEKYFNNNRTFECRFIFPHCCFSARDLAAANFKIRDKKLRHPDAFLKSVVAMQEKAHWERKLAWAAQSKTEIPHKQDVEQESAKGESSLQLANHEKVQEEADVMMNNPEEGFPELEAVRVKPYFSGSLCMQLQYSALGSSNSNSNEHSRELVHKAISDAVCAGLMLPPNCHVEGEEKARLIAFLSLKLRCSVWFLTIIYAVCHSQAPGSPFTSEPSPVTTYYNPLSSPGIPSSSFSFSDRSQSSSEKLSAPQDRISGRSGKASLHKGRKTQVLDYTACMSGNQLKNFWLRLRHCSSV